jgi:hypothetical protein
LIGGKQFERTLALVDISEKDSYLIDVFRVAGGKEHTRFLHGHFGQTATRGLSPVPVDVTRYGEVMRNFRRDAQPQEGWGVDWKIEDHLKYLPAGSQVQFRHMDCTRGAEVELAESWVAVGLYGGTADAWIPSVLVRHRAEQAPLASTFVAVMEPCEAASNLGKTRRLELLDADGKTRPDEDVALEIQRADGGRDLFLSRNVERQADSASAMLVEKESSTLFEGDLCWVRFDASNQPTRVAFCRGRSLRVGELLVQANDSEASFEIELANRSAPAVAGSADAVGLIELDGVKIWPK